MRRLRKAVGTLGISIVIAGCSPASAPPVAPVAAKPQLPPEPVVNHTAANAEAGQRVEHGEWIVDVEEATRQLNAQHHSYKVLETRRVPDRSRSRR